MTCCFLPNTGKGRNRIAGFFPAFTFILLFAALACLPAVADPVVQITQCGTVITQPGHYILANDLNCGAPSPSAPTTGNTNLTVPWQQMQNPFTTTPQAPTPDQTVTPFGILILADHVDLALDGHTISGNLNSETFGIAVGNPFSSSTGQSHVHIVGPGTVTGWLVAVFLNADSFSSVSEVTADTNAVGFIDLAGSKNAFDGNTATNSTGFFLVAGGITLLGSSGDAVRNNTVTNNFFGIIDEGGANNDVRFNTVTGNFDLGIGIASTNDSIFHNTATGTIGGPDLDDANANCDSNTWKNNTFGTANQPCIN